MSLLPGQTGENEDVNSVVVEKSFAVLVSAGAGSGAVEYAENALVAPADLTFVIAWWRRGPVWAVSCPFVRPRRPQLHLSPEHTIRAK